MQKEKILDKCQTPVLERGRLNAKGCGVLYKIWLSGKTVEQKTQ